MDPRRYGTVYKGLQNQGANNCFVNVIIQSLFHLYSFKKEFAIRRIVHDHLEENESCLLCELKLLLNKYQESDSNILPPEGLRRALYLQNLDNHKFDLQEMGCAVEAYEEVLKYLHRVSISQVGTHNTAMSKDEAEDIPCQPLWIAHDMFQVQMCDMWVWSCGNTGDFENMEVELGLRAYIDELINVEFTSSEPFSKRLSSTLTNMQQRTCDLWQRPVQLKKWCIEAPDVLSIALTWAEPTLWNLSLFLPLLEPVLLTKEVMLIANGQAINDRYIFRGMVVFRGCHYIAYFYSVTKNTWVLFSDEHVESVGQWNQVCEQLHDTNAYPVLLFYESSKIMNTAREEAQMMRIEASQKNQYHGNSNLDSLNYYNNWDTFEEVNLAGLVWYAPIQPVKSVPKGRASMKKQGKKTCNLF